jgi:hypothetical protein
LKAKAAGLIAGKSSRWGRIRALTEFVQKEVSYLAVVLDTDYLAGYRPHATDEVLRNRFGDCKDKASLLVSLLRCIGEDGFVVLAAAGNPKAIEPSWPSARFNHAIAALPADEAVPASWPTIDAGPLGRLVVFDPTDPNTPLGVLSSGDQGGFGLVASAKSEGLVRFPIATAEANRFETTVRATLDARGDLLVKVEEVSSGGIGVALHAARENLRSERFTPVLETRLRENLSFMEQLQWKDTWQAASAEWRLEYDFKAPRYARRTGGSLIMVSPQVVFSKTRMIPWKTKQDGVVWTSASTQRKTVHLALPAGAVVEEVPENLKMSGKFVQCRLQYRREGEEVVYDYELTQAGGFLAQQEYEGLRTFIQKVQEAERRPILIRAAAAESASAK